MNSHQLYLTLLWFKISLKSTEKPCAVTIVKRTRVSHECCNPSIFYFISRILNIDALCEHKDCINC